MFDLLESRERRERVAARNLRRRRRGPAAVICAFLSQPDSVLVQVDQFRDWFNEKAGQTGAPDASEAWDEARADVVNALRGLPGFLQQRESSSEREREKTKEKREAAAALREREREKKKKKVHHPSFDCVR